jgi:hypothetical protein
LYQNIDFTRTLSDYFGKLFNAKCANIRILDKRIAINIDKNQFYAPTSSNTIDILNGINVFDNLEKLRTECNFTKIIYDDKQITIPVVRNNQNFQSEKNKYDNSENIDLISSLLYHLFALDEGTNALGKRFYGKQRKIKPIYPWADIISDIYFISNYRTQISKNKKNLITNIIFDLDSPYFSCTKNIFDFLRRCAGYIYRKNLKELIKFIFSTKSDFKKDKYFTYMDIIKYFPTSHRYLNILVGTNPHKNDGRWFLSDLLVEKLAKWAKLNKFKIGIHLGCKSVIENNLEYLNAEVKAFHKFDNSVSELIVRQHFLYGSFCWILKRGEKLTEYFSSFGNVIDFSSSFPDMIGFRNGTTYRINIYFKNKKYFTIVPVVFMDATIINYYNKGNKWQSHYNKSIKYCKKYSGEISINLHNHNYELLKTKKLYEILSENLK